jgi:hypothetical protein
MAVCALPFARSLWTASVKEGRHGGGKTSPSEDAAVQKILREILLR